MVLCAAINRAIAIADFHLFSTIVMLLMVAIYTSTGGTLSPAKVFGPLTLTFTIRLSMFLAGIAFMETSEVSVALKRIKVCYWH